MRLLWNSLLFLFSAALLPAIATAQTLQTLETFMGSDPTTCTAPPITSSFSSSDTTVNAYFLLTGMNQNGGDVVKLYWYGPTNNLDVTTTWNATAGGYTSWCFSTDLNIVQYIDPLRLWCLATSSLR
jgi:hypothetical protein